MLLKSSMFGLTMNIYFFRILGHKYASLANMGSEGITQLTGCKKPCVYHKYSLIGKYVTMFPSQDYLFSLLSVSNNTRVETEVLVYPLTSLVAEFGGTLGLFLGVSFLTIWDGAQYMVKKIEIKPPTKFFYSQHLSCMVRLCLSNIKLLV